MLEMPLEIFGISQNLTDFFKQGKAKKHYQDSWVFSHLIYNKIRWPLKRHSGNEILHTLEFSGNLSNI